MRFLTDARSMPSSLEASSTVTLASAPLSLVPDPSTDRPPLGLVRGMLAAWGRDRTGPLHLVFRVGTDPTKLGDIVICWPVSRSAPVAPVVNLARVSPTSQLR